MRDKLRVKHYSIRTEQTYVDWIKRYIYYHGKRHPKDLGVRDIEAFLTHLVVAGKVAASTQNLAKSSILFLYREVQSVLSHLSGTHALIASLLYGGGMRLMETVRLRMKDVEFARHEIVVREGKGVVSSLDR